MKGGIVMDNHSMMELGEDLNGKFNDLVNYCMLSGVIDLDHRFVDTLYHIPLPLPALLFPSGAPSGRQSLV